MTVPAPVHPLSAKAARVSRQEQTARDLARILDAHDVSAAQVAAETGASAQHVSAWRDADAEKNLSVADSRAIASVEVRRGLMDLIGGSELVAVRRHQASPAAIDVKTAARLLRVANAAIESLLSALEDGIVDPAERRDALAKMDALICDVESLRCALLASEAPKPLRSVGSRS